jgi:hypothetical protein
VLRRADFQGAMRLLREVADGDSGHDGVLCRLTAMLSK